MPQSTMTLGPTTVDPSESKGTRTLIQTSVVSQEDRTTCMVCVI